MVSVSVKLNLHELSEVLPERLYPVLSCLHSTKMEALNPRGL